jgi:hypothetical protein
MASTRNKNTAGDYNSKQQSFRQQSNYCTNIDYSISTQTLRAGNGLLQGRLPDSELSHNPNDIESFLFGIGSTNLVTPNTQVKPELKNIKELYIIDRRVPLIMPNDLVLLQDQRPTR